MWPKIKHKIDQHVARYFDNRAVLNIGSDSFIHPDCMIRGATISGNVHFEEFAAIKDGVNIQADSKVRIGRYTSLNGPNMDIRCRINPVHIGNFCSVARDVVIQEFNHPIDKTSTYYMGKKFFGRHQTDEAQSKGAITIGHDVWIGTHSVILSGAAVGHGAVIAANSVVNNDVPPYAIVAGSPARVIKKRFSEPIVQKLLELEWWHWDKDRIMKNEDLFTGKLSMEKIKRIK